ncbi:MAG: hypothetical protein OXC66_10105 [Roseovarius sp.]|nr:hypothetical protein [Roseovarius sp.]
MQNSISKKMRGHETQSIILHGSWIPGESGRCFAVWAEMTRQNRSPQNAKRHSCRAPKTVLYEFMKATWPELATDFVEKTVWAVLPRAQWANCSIAGISGGAIHRIESSH